MVWEWRQAITRLPVEFAFQLTGRCELLAFEEGEVEVVYCLGDCKGEWWAEFSAAVKSLSSSSFSQTPNTSSMYLRQYVGVGFP